MPAIGNSRSTFSPTSMTTWPSSVKVQVHDQTPTLSVDHMPERVTVDHWSAAKSRPASATGASVSRTVTTMSSMSQFPASSVTRSTTGYSPASSMAKVAVTPSRTRSRPLGSMCHSQETMMPLSEEADPLRENASPIPASTSSPASAEGSVRSVMWTMVVLVSVFPQASSTSSVIS